eukprot:8623648-Pyramimonas_sp.AAC.1
MSPRKRTSAEVKQRGGWKADRPAMRHEKGARLAGTWSRHPRWLQSHAERPVDGAAPVCASDRRRFHEASPCDAA